MYNDSVFGQFINAMDGQQRGTIKRLWLRYCHVDCLEELIIRFHQFSGLQQIKVETTFYAFETSEFHEERIQDVVEKEAHRVVEVLFERSDD